MRKFKNFILFVILIFVAVFEVLYYTNKDSVNLDFYEDNDFIEEILSSSEENDGTLFHFENITGEDLNIDIVYNPYYTLLTDSQKALYKQIIANTEEVETTFTPVNDVEVSELSKIFNAVLNDHPELFWLDNSFKYQYKADNTVTSISLQYNDLSINLENNRAIFDAAVKSIVDAASKYETITQKEKYVHDILASTNTYVDDAEYDQSAFSAIVNNKTVCAGYAKAFQLIMNELGIPTYFIEGYTDKGEVHAWNMISLNGKYYNVDVTWDDQESGTIYAYYNKTDNEFAKDHIRNDESLKVGPANG